MKLTTHPSRAEINPLNAELNPICHLLALLGAHPILHVSRIRVKNAYSYTSTPHAPSWLHFALPYTDNTTFKIL